MAGPLSPSIAGDSRVANQLHCPAEEAVMGRSLVNWLKDEKNLCYALAVIALAAILAGLGSAR